MNYGIAFGMMHNEQLIHNAENFLNECISAGMYITVQNPDGTTVRLQKGFKIHSCEAVIVNQNSCEIIDFNPTK